MEIIIYINYLDNLKGEESQVLSIKGSSSGAILTWWLELGVSLFLFSELLFPFRCFDISLVWDSDHVECLYF